MSKVLKDVHKALMKRIENGADVYGDEVAKQISWLDKNFPGLIKIGDPVKYDKKNNGPPPHFGAILTEEGKKACQK